MSDSNGNAQIHTSTTTHRPLTAADILAPLLPEPFPLPELGGVVYLYPLSAADAFDFANGKGDGWETAILKLISKAVVDAEGRPIFAGVPPEELRTRLPLHAFNRIQKELNRQMDAGYGVAPAGKTAGGEPVSNPFVQTAGESSAGPSSEPEPPATAPDTTTRTPPAPAS